MGVRRYFGAWTSNPVPSMFVELHALSVFTHVHSRAHCFGLSIGWRTPYYGERRQKQKEDNDKEKGVRRETHGGIRQKRAGIVREVATRELGHPDSPSSPKSFNGLRMTSGSKSLHMDGRNEVDTVGPSDCGCSRYEVYSRFNKKSQ